MYVLQCHSSTVYNSQDMEEIYVSPKRCMDKEDLVYIHNGILLRHKKEGNIATRSNMDGPREYHTKWSKSRRERQILNEMEYSEILKK